MEYDLYEFRRTVLPYLANFNKEVGETCCKKGNALEDDPIIIFICIVTLAFFAFALSSAIFSVLMN